MSWVELGQSPSCLLNPAVATTGDAQTEALGDTKKLPGLTCHMLVSHLTTSIPSLSRTDDHGSPLWFWHTSIRFGINDKSGVRSPKARRAWGYSPSPLCVFTSAGRSPPACSLGLSNTSCSSSTPAIRFCPAAQALLSPALLLLRLLLAAGGATSSRTCLCS